MPKITVPQKKMTFDAPTGESLMLSLQAHGIPVASSCLGDGICGKCRVKIVGDLAAPSDLETETLLRNKCSPENRLACQVQIMTDLIVETTYW
ncbi:MAG: 2Fe-2S iron-sulfur cluster binding domain-containing protein [Bdellovibrionaceae bacterium]|nr:2Fe-2S iron-sulfur cluster binding domain-containing protein [Bdellovibrio sp.]